MQLGGFGGNSSGFGGQNWDYLKELPEREEEEEAAAAVVVVVVVAAAAAAENPSRQRRRRRQQRGDGNQKGIRT